MTTWPLWECLKPEQLAKLVLFQWENYGTVPEFFGGKSFRDFESLEEIDRLMRQKPKGRAAG